MVRIFGYPFGEFGYSLAAFLVISLSGAAIFCALKKSGTTNVVALAVLLLVLLRPVVFPQFTLTSGISMVGAVACIHFFGRNRDFKILVFGLFLAYLAYIIRSQEAILVLFVAIPLLPWRAILASRSAKIAFCFFVTAILSSAVIDYQSYRTDDWKDFNEINLARAPYTDFGASVLIRQRPDIFHRYDLSENDVALITDWGLYAAPDLANPSKLKAMLNDLGWLPHKNVATSNVLFALKAFFNPYLLPLGFAALFSFFITPNRRGASVFGLAILSISIIALLGRPGVLRIYYPLLLLNLVSILLLRKDYSIGCKRLAVIVCVALFFNFYNVFTESRTLTLSDRDIRSSLSNFPDGTVFVWGDGFPYEAAYPVFASQSTKKYRIYGFGVFSPAPFSVAKFEQIHGRGFVDRFSSDEGVPLVAGDKEVGILNTYCEERLKGIMKASSSQYGRVKLRTLQCQARESIKKI